MLIQNAIMNDPRYNQGLTRVVAKNRIEDCETDEERHLCTLARSHFEERVKTYMKLGYTRQQAIIYAS